MKKNTSVEIICVIIISALVIVFFEFYVDIHNLSAKKAIMTLTALGIYIIIKKTYKIINHLSKKHKNNSIDRKQRKK